MYARMLKKDLKRNRTITATLVLFIAFASLLVSLSASLIVELLGAMDSLFEGAQAPHFVQMHSGDVDQQAVDDFVTGNPLVLGQQTVEMQNVPGRAVTFGDSKTTEAASVMEIAFVTQNRDFDYLLDLTGEIAQVEVGQVGVPVYFMQQRKLRVGDILFIDCGDTVLELTITSFVRDVQMNPSIVTSKRFLVHPSDWEVIRDTVGTSEYLIEFLLTDPSQVGGFEQAYLAAGLPQSDTAITYSLYQLLNALTDGMVAAVLILIGLLLVLIAMLCLRYTLLGAMEEDTREIGIMKAIGLSDADIRKTYLVKYSAVTAVACLLGYALSLPMQGVLLGNISLYMGLAPRSTLSYLAPLLAVGIVFVVVILLVRLVLRRLRRLTAVEALRTGMMRDIPAGKRRLSLRKNPVKRVNAFLALQDLWLRLKSYCLLGFVFALCAFLAITPINLYNTVSSPRFITYMGAGASDLRIDLQKADDMEATYQSIAEHLQRDPDVARFSAFVTGTFRVQDSEGEWVTIKVENGDFSVFDLEYAEGMAPETVDQIALSSMNADELGKGVGETLTLIVEGVPREMKVCGVYQDVTNGGKTAKALLPVGADNVVWYVLNADVADGVDNGQKKDELAGLFAEARVLDMEDYLEQTMGAVTRQLSTAAIGGFAVASLVSVLVTAMFFHMMLAKDISQTVILKSLGFSNRDLHVQYILRAAVVLVAGILLGTLAVVTLGEALCGALFCILGAADIRFIVNPVVSYLLAPTTLLLGVIVTAWASSCTINQRVELRPAND